jgi:CheY-like chemotaxis protein
MAKLLIVDDDPDHAESLCRVLKAFGHETASAPNGREALSEVINKPPQLVILDLLMPEMDGPSFLEVVRSYMRLRTLPVIVLTGIPDGPLMERARRATVSGILIKGRATTQHIQQAIQSALVGVGRDSV